MDLDRYLTYDELSEMLSVPKGTLYSWVHHGTVPYVRFSQRCVRFRLRDIEAWIGERQQRPPGQSNRPDSETLS